MSNNNDSFWIEWNGPDSKEDTQYLAVSESSGLYWTQDVQDSNIVDGSELEIKYDIETTIKQLSEKWKLQKGKQFERFNLFKHPEKHCWLAVEKLPNGQRDPETNKVIRKYQAYWTHKFKAVAAISRVTGKCQGNAGFQNKQYAQKASQKAKEERRRRLENIEKASKRLNFNPAEQLIAWATGDEEKLNTKQPITNAQRLKSLEILASYTWAKPKPFDPQLADKMKKDTGPGINVVLPADGSEVKGKVLEHQSEEALQEYLSNSSKEVYSEYEEDTDAGSYDYQRARFELPEENE